MVDREEQETLNRYLLARHATAVKDCHELVRMWWEHNRDRERERRHDARRSNTWTKTLVFKPVNPIDPGNDWDRPIEWTYADSNDDDKNENDEDFFGRRTGERYLQTYKFMHTVLPREYPSTEPTFDKAGGMVRHYAVTPEWCVEWAPWLVHRLWMDR